MCLISVDLTLVNNSSHPQKPSLLPDKQGMSIRCQHYCSLLYVFVLRWRAGVRRAGYVKSAYCVVRGCYFDLLTLLSVIPLLDDTKESIDKFVSTVCLPVSCTIENLCVRYGCHCLIFILDISYCFQVTIMSK